jgi:hypothetical protein
MAITKSPREEEGGRNFQSDIEKCSHHGDVLVQHSVPDSDIHDPVIDTRRIAFRKNGAGRLALQLPRYFIGSQKRCLQFKWLRSVVSKKTNGPFFMDISLH